jgi:hypothetical protein
LIATSSQQTSIDRVLAYILLGLGLPVLLVGLILLLSPAATPTAAHLDRAIGIPSLVLGAISAIAGLGFYRHWRLRWLLFGSAWPVYAIVLRLLDG